MSEQIPLTEFDGLVSNKELNILKAALPFISPEGQRFLSVFIKFRELINTINLINHLPGKNVGICTPKNDDNSPSMKIINAIKIYLSKDEVNAIDNYINMFNTLKMFNELSEMFNDNDETGEGGSNMDFLKSMLSPEQQSIFESFSNMS